MDKPKVFISSTVHDFLDMRSAIKYWLEEAGYSVQLSESCDFQKDSRCNSYDACLESISTCDYFVLLIGSRVGGMYDKDISITRREYREALELVQAGKLKKIITFVRGDVWVVLEDRKGLEMFLRNSDIKVDGIAQSPKEIMNFNSKVMNGAAHIVSFIDEVSRKEEFKNGAKPSHNWVNVFNSFDDIISVLKVELSLHIAISRRIAEQNIRLAMAWNLQGLLSKWKDKTVVGYFTGFRTVRSKMKQHRTDHSPTDSEFNKITLSNSEVKSMTNFVLFLPHGIEELETFVIDGIISEGEFLTYNYDSESFSTNCFNKALHDYCYEIRRIKRYFDSKAIDAQTSILKIVKGFHNESYDLPFYELAMLNSIYECEENILALTLYILEYIENHDDSKPYPVLLRGFVDSERPSEEDIFETLNKIIHRGEL